MASEPEKIGKRGPQGGVEMAKLPVGRQIPEEGHYIKDPPGRKTNVPNPPAIVPPAAAAWMTEVDSYLESRGWEKVGVSETGMALWKDPEGSTLNAEEYREIILSVNKETGRPDVVRQKILPPIPWEYSTMDALRHQKQRDMWADSASLTPLQRLEKLEAKHNRMRRAYDRFIALTEKVKQSKLPTIDPSSSSNYMQSVSQANHYISSLKDKLLVAIQAAKAEYESVKLSEDEIKQAQEFWKERKDSK
jgi:hypothetical protein